MWPAQRARSASHTSPDNPEALSSHGALPALKGKPAAHAHTQGSTCAMVESILRCCGYRTGLFTSPHLWDVRERIQLDGCAPAPACPFFTHVSFGVLQHAHANAAAYGVCTPCHPS